MSRTRRREPTDREARYERLEREWEQKAKRTRVQEPESEPESEAFEMEDSSLGLQVIGNYSEREIEAIRQEAQALVTEREKAASRRPYSVQDPATDYPHEAGGGLLWWTGTTLDQYIPLSDWGSPQRATELRTFALIAPLVLLAESVLTKKVQSLQWTIEGGRNLAQKWQKRLNNFENGDGWDYFIARWIRSYCEADQAACAELIRSAPSWAVDDNGQLTPRGERAIANSNDATWEIVDSRVMDPTCVYPTISKEYPIRYHNPWTGAKVSLRPYQFMSLIDLPAVDDRYPLYGVCAVSRAVWAAQEDRMVIRYCMEKMSENPGAGIGVINASTTALETALNSAKAQREARGVVYYKGVIFLPVLDPSGGTKLEFLSFSDLPAGFERSEVYNILKEIVATAFGLDILELGSIPGRLGTATQAKVAAQKGRTKTIGAIMQGIERAFRYKLLPESVTFQIKKHDQDEEMQRAEIDALYFENAIRYAQFAPDPRLPNQYLIDKGAVPNEFPYRIEDITPREEVGDVRAPSEEVGDEEGGSPQVTEAPAVAEGPEGAAESDVVKAIRRRWALEGPRVRIDREGKIVWMEPPPGYRTKQFYSLPPLDPSLTRVRRKVATLDG